MVCWTPLGFSMKPDDNYKQLNCLAKSTIHSDQQQKNHNIYIDQWKKSWKTRLKTYFATKRCKSSFWSLFYRKFKTGIESLCSLSGIGYFIAATFYLWVAIVPGENHDL